MSQSRGLDTICIESKNTYPVYISIGVQNGEDFSLHIEFLNLSKNAFDALTTFTKEQRALKIDSMLLKQKNYTISHILITGITIQDDHKMIWECLSQNQGS